ncbi:MAG: hypothetical protein FWG38_04025 [Defluviitaleaceae bacterium]|nr:hypothetical protein [Defluviitaleaceae bacterium]
MMVNRPPQRSWDILLIGGASGVGKTYATKQIAKQYGIDLVRVDDFQALLEATTTPESHPAVHYWATHPNWRDEGVDAAVERLVDVGKMLTPGLAAVVNDHIIENIPMVLEGDFILPALAASLTSPKVKSVFVLEPSREQILQNFLAREGSHQVFRANVSYAYNCWLMEHCKTLGIPLVDARP